MKSYIIFLIAISLHLSARAQDAGEIAVPLSDLSQRGVLDVNIKRGSIKVVGTSRSDVLVKYQAIKSKSEGEGEVREDGLRKINTNHFDLEISEDDNVVEIESNSWMRGVDLEIEVPSDINLDLHNHTGRYIEVENISGDINLESYTGRIDALAVSGVVQASTYSGRITVDFDEITADKAMAFTNYSGKIDLTLPSDYQATFRMKTSFGDIYTGFDMDMSTSPNTLTKQEGGNFKMATDRWTTGTINGGGPEVTIKNFSGGIYLRKK